MINIYHLINDSRKSGDKVRLSVYQALLSELQKYETSKNAELLTESKQLEIFNKYAKSLNDSISEFAKAGREDLFKQYTQELNIVKELLPAPVTGDRILDFIRHDEYFSKYIYYVADDAEAYLIEIPKKEMGACIKYVKSKFPTSDGKDISNIIKAMVI